MSRSLAEVEFLPRASQWQLFTLKALRIDGNERLLDLSFSSLLVSTQHMFILSFFLPASVSYGTLQSVIQMVKNIFVNSVICNTTKLTIDYQMKRKTFYIVTSHSPSGIRFSKYFIHWISQKTDIQIWSLNLIIRKYTTAYYTVY